MMTARVLLELYANPSEYSFKFTRVMDFTQLLFLKQGRVVCEVFFRHGVDVKGCLKAILQQAIRYGEQGFLKGKTFISEYCVQGIELGDYLTEGKVALIIAMLDASEVCVLPQDTVTG